MIYVLALIGAVAIVALVWRTFDTQGRALTATRREKSTVPPDDDPDFLRRLGEQHREQDDDGDGDHV